MFFTLILHSIKTMCFLKENSKIEKYTLLILFKKLHKFITKTVTE